MGAHTLGNAHGNISGYNGVWIEGQMTQFNNKYYQYLVDTTLTFTNTVSRIKVYKCAPVLIILFHEQLLEWRYKMSLPFNSPR